MTEQQLFDALVNLNKQALTIAEDISQLKKDTKYHKDINPSGISVDDIKFVAALLSWKLNSNLKNSVVTMLL